MDAKELERTQWDAVIVGAGMGGATLGHALAQAGWKVLFCERGRSLLNGNAVRDTYPEMLASGGNPDSALLASTGRFPAHLTDCSGREKRFLPFIGSGGGGSSALYGMVLERFFPSDFVPGAHHARGDSSLPEAWPISYDELLPHYEAAERLYRVRGGGDPLRPDRVAAVGEAVPMSAVARELAAGFEQQGLHPYALPLACEYVPGCRGCQGFLCGSDCKNDSGRICLEPAVRKLGANLIDCCEVVRVEADRSLVTGLVCRRDGDELRIRANMYVLAAGALATPALLLASRNEYWPEGVANRSGLVGRNLMRHYVDLYAVFPRAVPMAEGNAKEFGCNDFYLSDGLKLGAIQSFGKLPPGAMISDGMQRDLAHDVHPWVAKAFGLFKPIVRPAFDRMFGRASIVATIIEDLPYESNYVLPPAHEDGGIRFIYQVVEAEARRIDAMRAHMKRLLRNWRHLPIRQAENNERIAHACGTCRFGIDPAASVLDAQNRAHGIDNLYVVDASFFPSSGGTNPALTIAANALRVADHLLGKATTRGAA